jgi:hypothetical protein
VSFLKELARKNQKVAPVISTLVCVAITWERAQSFAQSQKNSPDTNSPNTELANEVDSRGEQNGTPAALDLPSLKAENEAPTRAKRKQKSSAKSERVQTTQQSEMMIPLEHRQIKKFDSVKTKKEACRRLEGQVLSYYDTSTYVLNCIQRPIEDPNLLNEMVYKKRIPVVEVPAHVYRLIPFGEAWSGDSSGLSGSKVCRDLNEQYVTSTGSDYYYIQGCKKRPFASYSELQAHNNKNAPVRLVSPDELERLDEGKKIEGSYNREVEALYRIVGDSSLRPKVDGRNKFIGSTEELEAIPGAQRADKKFLCRKFNKKIISFYSQLYYIIDCTKRPIASLPVTFQKKLAESGKQVTDLDSAQIDAIPLGKDIGDDEALELLK